MTRQHPEVIESDHHMNKYHSLAWQKSSVCKGNQRLPCNMVCMIRTCHFYPSRLLADIFKNNKDKFSFIFLPHYLILLQQKDFSLFVHGSICILLFLQKKVEKDKPELSVYLLFVCFIIFVIIAQESFYCTLKAVKKDVYISTFSSKTELQC